MTNYLVALVAVVLVAGLDIVGRHKLACGDWAAAIANLRDAHEARVVLREHNLETIQIQDILGDALTGSGRYAEALAVKQDVSRRWDEFGASVFEAVPEPSRMKVLAQMARSQAGFLSLVLRRFAADPRAVRSVCDAICRRKGLGLELMCMQRDAAMVASNPRLSHCWTKLQNVRRRLTKHYLDGTASAGGAPAVARIADLERERRQMESELAAGVPAFELLQNMRRADHRTMALALPVGVTLVEFIRLDVFDFQAVATKLNELEWLPPKSWQPARYLAIVVSASESDAVHMIDLGEAESIDRLIADFRADITGESETQAGRDLGAAPVESAHVSDTSHGPSLRAAVFDKLVPALAGCKRLLLAPDGDLTRLPFEVLPTTDGSRLIDEYEISYVATGRDVLRFGATSNRQPAEPLVVADPDFDLGNDASSAASTEKTNDRHSRDLDRGLRFPPLPATRSEGKFIATLLGVTPWLDGTALESRLKACRSPRILHLATHGFFLTDQKRDPNTEFRDLGALPGQEAGGLGRLSASRLENPLLRSGLALAGANTWLQNGNPPAEAEDGLLTAEDVTGLDLLDTDLVVLSACETGLGEIHVGEGVFGLRRAFVLAGAKTLVMSLWKVPDQQTQELMEDFYGRILEGQPRAEALRQAQLAMKHRYPHPLYWGAFICQGEPGPLRVAGSVESGKPDGTVSVCG